MHQCPISGILGPEKFKKRISGLFRTHGNSAKLTQHKSVTTEVFIKHCNSVILIQHCCLYAVTTDAYLCGFFMMGIAGVRVRGSLRPRVSKLV